MTELEKLTIIKDQQIVFGAFVCMDSDLNLGLDNFYQRTALAEHRFTRYKVVHADLTASYSIKYARKDLKTGKTYMVICSGNTNKKAFLKMNARIAKYAIVY